MTSIAGRVLPWRDLELSTRLTAREIVEVVRGEKESRNWDVLAVDEHGFRLRRIILHRNSFLPEVRATITPAGSGSRVRVAIDVTERRAMVVLLAFSAFVVVSGALVATRPGINGEPLHGVALALVAVAVWAVISFSFAHEADLAEAFLRERLPEPAAPSTSAFR